MADQMSLMISTNGTYKTVYKSNNVFVSSPIWTIDANSSVTTAKNTSTYTYTSSNTVYAYPSIDTFNRIIDDVCSEGKMLRVGQAQDFNRYILKSLECNFTLTIRLSYNMPALGCDIQALAVDSSYAKPALKSMRAIIAIMKRQANQVRIKLANIPVGLADALDVWVDISSSLYDADGTETVISNALKYISNEYNLEITKEVREEAWNFRSWLDRYNVKYTSLKSNYGYMVHNSIFIRMADFLAATHPSYPEVPLFTEYLEKFPGIYNIFCPDNNTPFCD